MFGRAHDADPATFGDRAIGPIETGRGADFAILQKRRVQIAIPVYGHKWALDHPRNLAQNGGTHLSGRLGKKRRGREPVMADDLFGAEGHLGCWHAIGHVDPHRAACMADASDPTPCHRERKDWGTRMRGAERLAADAAGIARAAELLRAGELVAFPTETVYGLGADARNGQAVARIFEAKSRPRFNPLIVHVASAEAAARLVDLPEAGQRLASAFWPGPLTLVAPRRADAEIAELVSAGLPTLAVRVPEHEVAQALLRRFGGPVAAPSANPSGRISPTTADHVLEGLGDRIAAVLDGGPCQVGLESTIIGFDAGSGRAMLLRPGGVPVEAIEEVLGEELMARAAGPGGAVSAPGQLASHYAPEATLRLGVTCPRPGELWLGFGHSPGADVNLSPSGDLREAAANLFSYLRRLDRLANGRGIAVAPIPEIGLGRAINDRLARAAAPRDPPVNPRR